ncbi:unnamed protein product, partial [Ectocarpus sp. 12 AP-2014]
RATAAGGGGRTGCVPEEAATGTPPVTTLLVAAIAIAVDGAWVWAAAPVAVVDVAAAASGGRNGAPVNGAKLVAAGGEATEDDPAVPAFSPVEGISAESGSPSCSDNGSSPSP